MAKLVPPQRPFHVINLTLNLVAGGRLAWQQRKAAPFTVSPLHCGSRDLGYRPSAGYAGGITLGVWLGNPGKAGEHTWKQAGPRTAIFSLAAEALGQSTDSNPYVYLSDDGHFENLGLYEMVRRQCRTIVVIDAGCDPDCNFGDLGNTLRKIRIDQQVSIDFDAGALECVRRGERRFALAAIRYREDPIHDGRLIYIRPVLTGDEPPDVGSYAAANKTFPHESTAIQWFNGSQTESYRQLGLCTVWAMSDGERPGSLDRWRCSLPS